MKRFLHIAGVLAVLCILLAWACQSKPPEVTATRVVRPVFPKPMFISAPWVCTLPNFEDANRIPATAFTAPETTALISMHVPVRSSHRPTHGVLALLTDGEASSDDTTEVRFAANPVWIELDLLRSQLIDQIWIWHGEGTFERRMTPEVFVNMVVQISPDREFKEKAVTLFNSDDRNTLGLGIGNDPVYMETNRGRGVAARGRLARYVRIWGGGAYSGGPNRFVEVQVWGRPAP